VLMGDNRRQGLHPAAFKPRERLGDAFLDVPHLPKSRVQAALGFRWATTGIVVFGEIPSYFWQVFVEAPAS
jgi:hypothetical protein